MVIRSHVEHDFLGMQPSPRPQPRLDRRQSFRGISKINPDIVRSVLASSASTPQNAMLPTPSLDSNLFSRLPVFQPNPFSRSSDNKESSKETAPMTIFYKGTVSVVDLPKEKAEAIIKFVMEKSSSSDILDTPDAGELSIKRKQSYQRFFEKRKERLISVSPYQVEKVSQLQQKSFN